MMNLKEYNKYFEDDEYMPCSQMPTQITTQVLKSVDLNVQKPETLTSKFLKSKSDYREPAKSNEENSIPNSIPSSNLISQITQQDDNTQIKRMKFFENIMDSTYPEPAKQQVNKNRTHHLVHLKIK